MKPLVYLCDTITQDPKHLECPWCTMPDNKHEAGCPYDHDDKGRPNKLIECLALFMNFVQLQTDVAQWSARNFPDKKPHQPLLGLAEEVGELSHAHLKAEQGIRGTPAEHQTAKEDAVGDIAIYLADYCTHNGIDLQHTVEAVWGKVKQRDWRANKQNGEKHE